MKLSSFIILSLLCCLPFSLKSQENIAEFDFDFSNKGVVLEPGYRNNRQEIDKLVKFINEVRQDPNVEITNITINGYTTLESTHEGNTKMANNRRKALENLIGQYISLPKSVYKYNTEYIDWEWLKKELSNAKIAYADEAIAIINRPKTIMNYFGNFTRDRRIFDLRWLGKSSVWNYMEQTLFPKMAVAQAIITTKRAVSAPEEKVTAPVTETDEKPGASKSQSNVLWSYAGTIDYGEKDATEPSHEETEEETEEVVESVEPVEIKEASSQPELWSYSGMTLPSGEKIPEITSQRRQPVVETKVDIPSRETKTKVDETPTLSFANEDFLLSEGTSIIVNQEEVEVSDNTIIVKPGTLIIQPGTIIIKSDKVIVESDTVRSAGKSDASAPRTIVYHDYEFMPRGHIKTNLVNWALGQVNFAFDFDFGPHWSFSLPINYAGWNYFKYTTKFRTFDFKPEFRYWTSPLNKGFYIGGHVGFVWFNYAFGGDYRYSNNDRNMPAIGGGISLGYRLPISRNGRWSMEFGASGGVYYVDYAKYVNTPGGAFEGEDKKTFFGPDGVYVSFIYSFNLRKAL